jgi:hypothetical protein
MLSIKNVINSKVGIIILSIVWGLGIACLFRKVCNGKNCIVIKAPHLEEIKGKTFKYEEKCYQYEPVNSQCIGDVVS